MDHTGKACRTDATLTQSHVGTTETVVRLYKNTKQRQAVSLVLNEPVKSTNPIIPLALAMDHAENLNITLAELTKYVTISHDSADFCLENC